MNSKKINQFLLSFIAISTGLQFDYLTFNNPYVVPFFCVVISFVWVVFRRKHSLHSMSLLFSFFAVLFVFSIVADNHMTVESNVRLIGYYGYIVIAAYTINILLKYSKIEDIERVLILFMVVGLFAASIEAVFRYAMPTLDLRSDNVDQLEYKLSDNAVNFDLFADNYFYIFKLSSIMFYDSNFVALFLLPIFVTSLFYLNNIRYSKKMLAVASLIFVLIVLTLSRAAILTAMTVMVIVTMREIFYKSKSLFVMAFFMAIILFIIYLIPLMATFSNDGSLETKVRIFQSLSRVSDINLVNLFFGFGVIDGATFYSYQEDKYAHALIPLILGQFGLVGLSLYVLSLTVLAYRAGFYGFILLFTVAIAGLSLVDPIQISTYFAFFIIARTLQLRKALLHK